MNVSLRGLSVVFALAIACTVIADRFLVTREERSDSTKMRNAVSLADRWYHVVSVRKQALGLYTPGTGPESGAMIGEEYSDITTTLGSVEAKTASADPLFAGLIVRMLDDAGIDSTKTVGITLSGSFPSLTIATLAAVQTIGAKAVIVSSLGASSYGANQPQATWIDIEGWLQKDGGLNLHSAFVTFGAEGDSGGGIQEEGIALLRAAIERNHETLYIPATFDDAVMKRVNLFQQNRISVYINIGGNQTALGACVHSTTIPNGYHATLRSCMDADRGVLVRMSELGTPVLHLLNIKDLAVKNGLPLIPEGADTSSAIYSQNTVRKRPVALIVLVLCGCVVWLGVGKRKASEARNS